MRYGGHQTFTLRDGWLYKGMELLMDVDRREKLVDPLAMDYLGVGRNMAKSINHWLLATGLAQKSIVENSKGKNVELKDLEPTDLAKIISKNDPFFMDLGTWWFMHINMVHNEEHGATWNWFFNKFGQDRFQKQVCLNSLMRYESIHSARNPSQQTLDRDLSCFLACYSKDIPSRYSDPEEEIISPLTDLGLMTYYRSSGYYNVARTKRDIPYFVFLYALKKAEIESSKSSLGQVQFYDLLQWTNSPSRIFMLGNDDLFEILLEYENQNNDFSMLGMAGERLVQYPRMDELELVCKYYDSRRVQ